MNSHLDRGSRGFTLVELMITLAIAAITITLVVPGISGIMQNNRINTAADEFILALSLARNEAVTRGTQVTLCKSANATSESDVDNITCTNGGKWEQGWIVFQDLNADRLRTSDETLLRTHPPIGGGIDLGGHNGVGADVTNSIAFDNNGFPVGLTTDTVLTVCDSRGFDKEFARAIAISPVGRAGISKVDNNKAVPQTIIDGNACL